MSRFFAPCWILKSALARAEARTGVIPTKARGYDHCPGEAWQLRCCCSFQRRLSSGYACDPSGEGTDGSRAKNQCGGLALRSLGRDQPGCRGHRDVSPAKARGADSDW